MAMYTEEQAHKAIVGKMFSDLKKQIALDNHKMAVEWVEQYNLPYRVSLDYMQCDKNKNKGEFDVAINPYYPLPQVPIEGVWNYDTDGGYTLEQWIDLTKRPTGNITSEGKKLVEFFIPTEIQTLINEKGKPYKKWNLDTEQGQEQWLYWFMVFIMPYKDKINSWSMFDMFGDNKHTQHDLEERKQYYLALIDKCIDNPKLYYHGIAQKELADYDLYDFKYGNYMWHVPPLPGNELTPPKHPQAKQIMQRELAILKKNNRCFIGSDLIPKIEQLITDMEQEENNTVSK